MIKQFHTALFAVALSLAAIAPALSQTATGKLMDTKNKTIGTVSLKQTPAGVLITAKAEGLTAGAHGFHIHETGACDPKTDFKSAGGHFSLDKKHGILVDGGPHPGDMPNAHVQKDGVLNVEVLNSRVSLKQGESGFLMDDDGSAVVIHSGADDYKSQPSGAAGNRVACAVLSLGSK